MKRRLTGGDAGYSVLRVDTERKLQSKLRKILTEKVQGKEYKIDQYSFLSADQDDMVLTIDIAETDFSKIEVEIEKKVSITTRPKTSRIYSTHGPMSCKSNIRIFLCMASGK